MNTTTRRHPRTLAEAFPDERAHCIERPRYDVTRAGHRAVVLFCCIGIVGVVAAIVIGWLR